MPPKRTRRTSPIPSGLSAGERLKRTKLTGNATYSAWGWVDSEVVDTSQITDEHRLATCSFSKRSCRSLCPNKYAAKRETPTSSAAGVGPKVKAKANGLPTPPPDSEVEATDDVIVISDDEGPSCTAKVCKYNRYCLNYLGQDKWEDAGESDVPGFEGSSLTLALEEAYEGYTKVYNPGENPLVNSRDGRMPIGLKVAFSPNIYLCECVSPCLRIWEPLAMPTRICRYCTLELPPPFPHTVRTGVVSGPAIS